MATKEETKLALAPESIKTKTKPQPPQAPPATVYLLACAILQELGQGGHAIKSAAISFDSLTLSTKPKQSKEKTDTMTVFHLPCTNLIIGITPHLTPKGQAFNNAAIDALYKEAKALEAENGVTLNAVL